MVRNIDTSVASSAPRPQRLLIYSHDGYGLGNIRRNLAICEYLAAVQPHLSILLLTGSPMAHAFRIPANVDYVKLPCVTRAQREAYRAKYWDLDAREVLHIRSEVILSTVKHFNPDLVLVDKKPVGIKKEFFPALTHLKVNSPETRIILGLRDILDEPGSTIPVWQKNQYFEIIQQFYDGVWIFGDPRVFDAVSAYRMPDGVAAKVTYTGYLARDFGETDRLAARAQVNLNGHPHVLVMSGGGGDGYVLMKNYVEVGKRLAAPAGYESLLVTGPEMHEGQRCEIEAICAASQGMQCRAFTDRIETYLMASDIVVAMGGYNTICEILTAGKRAVIVPRIRPVQEQYIRVARLHELGLVQMVHPDRLSPATLLEAIQEAARMPDPLARARQLLNLNGLPAIARLVQEQLEAAARTRPALREGRQHTVSEYA